MFDDENTTHQQNSAPSAARNRSGFRRSIAHRRPGDAMELPYEGRLGSFDGATSWINSEALTPHLLRGRVVLVDFWTYTCVNWLRTLPYVKAWAEKYAEAGLTIIGVHTPEFSFEGDLANVVAHTRQLGIKYPVAVDGDYTVWQNFANHYWPAVYIADADGGVRYHHFGEGEYARTEMVIQHLLLDAGRENFDADLVAVEPRGLEFAADWQTLRSPEIYLGYGQSSGFASEGVGRLDRAHVYATSDLPLNSWDLSGNWTVAREAVTLNEPGGRIAFRFQARDVNLVMGPVEGRSSIAFRIHLDGRVVDTDRGSDVAPDGSGIAADQNTYQLIRQAGPIANRLFEIEFLDDGVEAYCFTFG